MHLEYRLEAKRLPPHAAKNGCKPIVLTRSFIGWSFVQGAYSLSLAMGLTTILPPVAFGHRNAPKFRILIFKENWTSGDVRGHAANVWGSRVASSSLMT
jgi:hypothetical protein